MHSREPIQDWLKLRLERAHQRCATSALQSIPEAGFGCFLSGCVSTRERQGELSKHGGRRLRKERVEEMEAQRDERRTRRRWRRRETRGGLGGKREREGGERGREGREGERGSRRAASEPSPLLSLPPCSKHATERTCALPFPPSRQRSAFRDCVKGSELRFRVRDAGNATSKSHCRTQLLRERSTRYSRNACKNVD